MKINDQSNNEREALNIPKAQSERLDEAMKSIPGSTFTANRPDAPSDQIDLGSQDGLVARVQGAGSSERANRIEQLRALVQSGQYQVDTGGLSRSIIGATLSGY